MEVCGIVYSLTCKLNGKQYVGQTTHTIKERFNQHARKNSVVGKAICKHGRENFLCTVLKVCASKEELNRWEKFFIVLLNTKVPHGYNLTDGGEGTVGLERTPEHRAKISAARKGKALSLRHRAKIGAAETGEKNHFFGKHHTDEARAKISTANTGKKRTAEVRAKMSETRRGKKLKPRSPKHCAKISTAKRNNSPFKILIYELELRCMPYCRLAELMGLSRQSVCAKMCVKQKFTEKDKKKLAEIFGKPAEYLLQRDD